MRKRELTDKQHSTWVFVKALLQNGVLDYSQHRQALAEDEVYRPQLQELVDAGVLTKIGNLYYAIPEEYVSKKEIFWVGSLAYDTTSDTPQYRAAKPTKKAQVDKDNQRKSEIRQIICHYCRLDTLELQHYQQQEDLGELPKLEKKAVYTEEDIRLAFRIARQLAAKHRNWGITTNMIPAPIAKVLISRGWLNEAMTILSVPAWVRGFYPWESRDMPLVDVLKMMHFLLGSLKDGNVPLTKLGLKDPTLRLKFYKLLTLGVVRRSGRNFRFAKKEELRAILMQIALQEDSRMAG